MLHCQELDSLLEKAKAAKVDRKLMPLKDDILKQKFDNPKLNSIIKNYKKRESLIRMVSYECYLNKDNVD